MTITEISSTKMWEDFVHELNLNTFLHSYNWATFNRQLGEKVWQFGLFDSDTHLISVCLVILIEAKRGRFLLVPHGPQIKENLDHKEILNRWKNHLTKLAKQEKCSFVRLQPIHLDNEESRNLFKNLDFRPAPIHMHTELSTVLDITPSSEEILLKMRKTTRQMIKKGEKMVAKDEVKVEIVDHIDQEMHEVYRETYKRGGAVAYSEDFLNKEWLSFKNKSQLVTVKYENKIISWGMMLACGKRCFYHQGGNILNKKVPSAYLVQWQGILFAKKQGCISYDFWGVAPKEELNHPWTNISLFKRGFGGEDVKLLHAQDLILSWQYWFNWIIEKIRAKKRGF